MTKKLPTVVISGASGFLGSHLVDYFVAQGWQVVALVRTPPKNAKRKQVRYVAFDLSESFDATCFRGATYLVHAAYVKFDRQHPDALAVNVAGADRLLAASRKYKLRKNVFISSMSAHDEAVSVYGKQKLAVEALFNTKRDVVLRPGLIIGNGGIVLQMARFMRSKHVVPLIGGGQQPLQVVAVYDLVQVTALALASSLSGIFTIATPQVYTYQEFYQAIARQLGCKVAYVPVPFGLLLAVFRAVSLLHLPLSVNEDNLWGLKKLRAADTALDLRHLGARLDSLETALRKANLTARP